MATTNPSSPQTGSSLSAARRDSARPSWWWLALVPLIVAIPFLFRPAEEDQEQLNARRQQIENMSASERERLQQNFERFELLPAERKEALREIEDATAKNEELKSTLLQYERWLSSLSPWERQELREAESVEDKLEYVGTIVAARRQEEYEKQERDKQFAELVTRNLTNFQWPGQRPGGSKRVSDNDLSNMMAVLDAQYASRVKPNETILPGCAAYNIQLLTETLKAQIQQHGIENARQKPLPDETMRKMIEQIPDEEIRKLFDDWDSKKFVGYLAFKLESAWWSEAKQNPPSWSELDEIATTLGAEALSKFQEAKKENPRWAYFHLLMAIGPVNFYTNTKDLDEVMVKLELRMSPRPLPKPPRFGRSFGGDRRGDHRRDRGRDHGDYRKDDDDDRSRQDRDADEHRQGKDSEQNEDDSSRGEREPPPPPQRNEGVSPVQETRENS